MKIQARLFGAVSALLLTGAAAGKDSRKMKTKIVNGDPVEEPYPFYGFFEIGCGASIVAPDMVLTAAHCDYWDTLIRRMWFGSTKLGDGAQRTVVDRFPHPDYRDATTSTGAYDIMLMRVNASLFMDSEGNPTTLEAVIPNSNASNPEAGQELLVIGHGRSELESFDLEEDLLEVSLFAYDNEVCIEIYNQTEDPSSQLTVIPESMFCAGQGPEGFGGTCNGDSGGPIIDPATGHQVGIVSWGHACSRYGYPSVFGRVSSASDWIAQQICENSCYPDRDACATDTVFHPCAEAGDGGQSFLSSGDIGLNLKIISDSYPNEIAFALEMVEYGMEVYYQPYETYSVNDTAELEYGEDFVIQHSFENLPANATYRLVLGDSYGDGINCTSLVCNDTVALSFLNSGEEIWTHDGDYGTGTEVYVKFDEDGIITMVSQWETGVPPPTSAPTAWGDFSQEGYPGEFPDAPFEITINVKYDSFISETFWQFQRQAEPTADGTVDVQSISDDGWTTVAEGPEGFEFSDSIHSYNQSNLLPTTTYRFLFFDSYGDGISSWGATLTNSSASEDNANGTVLWSLPSSFSTSAEAYIWINEDGHSEVVSFGKVPPAPFYLGASCSRVGLAAGLAAGLGTSVCEDACSLATCCWDATAGELCTAFHSECSDYRRCANLLETGEEQVTAEDVASACEDHDTQAAGGGGTLCDIICVSGKCCFDGSECGDDVQCDVYEECAVVFVIDEDVSVEATERVGGPFD